MNKYLLILTILFPIACKGITEQEIDKIANCIFWAEGGTKTKYPYGILSIDTKGNKEYARKICKNTIRNNYKKWQKTDKKIDFITFLGSRYAPVGAFNDPKNLNSNWVKNVKFYLNKPAVQKP